MLSFVPFPLSIIIPTYRRPQILRRCLDAIGRQTLLRPLLVSDSRKAVADKPSFEKCPFEVIVVSDGPDEKTAEMMVSLEWPFPIQYFAIPKSQQGACRNAAVRKARGEIALLIGDDMLLAPDACERHLRGHERVVSTDEPMKHCNIVTLRHRDNVTMLQCNNVAMSGVAVLGHTTWDPSIKITPLMRWMEKSGVQFGYPKIERYRGDVIPQKIQHFFTYTSNISLPAKILYQNPFREDVSLYGWEDVELGKRLAEKGIPLIYEPEARVFHHHMYTDDEVWERSRVLGESAVRMEKLVPGLGIVPRGWKRFFHILEALLPTYRGRHWRAFLRRVKDDV